VQKKSPDRCLASRQSAQQAWKFLKEIGFPSNLIPQISHAIEAHSFSANVEPLTIEAKVVQDADRLDALGAIGIGRCFATGAALGQQFYEPNDPFAENRTLDDHKFTVDHFEVKLFKIAEALRTETARGEGQKRVAFMRDFLGELRREIQNTPDLRA
jgi:uncharacterized protein